MSDETILIIAYLIFINLIVACAIFLNPRKHHDDEYNKTINESYKNRTGWTYKSTKKKII